jgi:hypothetical protein
MRIVGLFLARGLGSPRTLLRPRFRAPRFTPIRTTRFVSVRAPPGLDFGAARFPLPSALPFGAARALLSVTFGARP